MEKKNITEYLVKIKKTIIDKLPKELVWYIYKNYLEVEVYYNIYKDIIKSPMSVTMNNTELLQFIPIVLSKQQVCKYISIKCFAFRSSYKKHKEDREKSFQLMKKGESFASSILFYLYH